MLNRSHIGLRIQHVIFVILLLVVVVLLAYVGKTYNKRFDLTHSQRNSLSVTMQTLLKKLDKPLEVIAYIPDDAVVKKNLKQLLKQYRVYHSDITLEIVNPDLEPERAQQDGIAYSGQLLLKYGDRKEAINSVDEQNVLNVLQRLSREKERLVIVLEGHNEASPLEDKPNGLSKLAQVLSKKGFNLQPHNMLKTQSIPDNASFVVVAAPRKEYLAAEVDLLTRYIEKGGNLLWLHEPGELYGLDDLEQQLGLVLHEGTLLDANQDLQRMLGIQHPAAIAIIDYGDSGLTTQLEEHTLFPFATAIEQEEQTDAEANELFWKYTPLLSTLVTSWLESGAIQGNVKFDDDGDKAGPLTIGMALQRENINAVTKDTKVIPQQRVVVLGDSDFMRNTYIGQGSNLAFASNLFNWLSADDNLLSIKSHVARGTRLNLSDQGRIGLALLAFGLPLLLLVVGMWRWLKRRKR